MSDKNYYTEGSSWPLGQTQISVLLALSDKRAMPVGHFNGTGWVGCEAEAIRKLAGLVISRNAMHNCLKSLLHRELIEKHAFSKRFQVYKLTEYGQREARKLRREGLHEDGRFRLSGLGDDVRGLSDGGDT